jgi:hypothetical protein
MSKIPEAPHSVDCGASPLVGDPVQDQSQLNPRDLQRQTLRLYGELVARKENWGGKLVFGCGEGFSASGLSAAVSIAGGASLVVDPNIVAVKSALRQGGIDFMVNSLDEALRTLKNEIRQKRPLGVALTAQPSMVLSEMLERGVLPDLQIGFEPSQASIEEQLQALSRLGMERLNLMQQTGAASPSPNLSTWLAERDWHETLFVVAPNTSDAALLATAPFAEGPRRAWLRGISRYQRLPDRTLRFVWLSGREQRSFAGLNRETSPAQQP